ncbi:MAG: molybdopterin-synthase adenylyltransferase MoeB, partial [Gammaproteobacteria bacterium]|nr:molybdopterin-synthase adenylyltransferase MoeB [Gammaproteobacteria bacterium]
MDDQQLLRYSRQILLPSIDFEGQQKLLAGRVLIIGMGGLGSPASLYLAGAGVGHLTIADFDEIDLSNLHRQVLYRTSDVGRQKVDAAVDNLRALNPEIEIRPLGTEMNSENLLAAVNSVDVVVDASDNFTTRFAINQACVTARKPLVSGAAIRTEGQVSVFRNDLPDSPCYRCLYRDEGAVAENCAQSGVMGPVVGTIGGIEAIETIKLITGTGTT